jgi:enamine deaminase RidA (YjgF/YER057c/UK114 family)
MPRKEIVDVKLAAPNPNLSPATRFGSPVFVAGQTGRHPTTGEVGRRDMLNSPELLVEITVTACIPD